ncbi:Uncharacterized protein FWK35_00022683 [Aphis craccivora]|uniref:Uncharacterized protein n=1 Tax=Aphis craccivora TaxID=307492 RepID=A0A6G0XZ12_APHCR|nr:Uncharacterized protein FWK35_00022683 [Aphis craccivora]
MDFYELTRFTQQEIQFISEYCDIMEPIAISLDFLQGEKAIIEAEAALKTVFTVDSIDSESSEDSQVDEDINEEKDFF